MLRIRETQATIVSFHDLLHNTRNRNWTAHRGAKWPHRIFFPPRLVQKCFETSFYLQTHVTCVDDFLSKSDHGLLEPQFALGHCFRLTLQNVTSVGCNERPWVWLFLLKSLGFDRCSRRVTLPGEVYEWRRAFKEERSFCLKERNSSCVVFCVNSPYIPRSDIRLRASARLSFSSFFSSSRITFLRCVPPSSSFTANQYLIECYVRPTIFKLL